MKLQFKDNEERNSFIKKKRKKIFVRSIWGSANMYRMIAAIFLAKDVGNWYWKSLVIYQRQLNYQNCKDIENWY